MGIGTRENHQQTACNSNRAFTRACIYVAISEMNETVTIEQQQKTPTTKKKQKKDTESGLENKIKDATEIYRTVNERKLFRLHGITMKKQSMETIKKKKRNTGETSKDTFNELLKVAHVRRP